MYTSDIIFRVSHGLDEDERKSAWDRLVARGPTERELCYIIRFSQEYQSDAYELLLESNPSEASLQYVSSHSPELLRQGPNARIEVEKSCA